MGGEAKPRSMDRVQSSRGSPNGRLSSATSRTTSNSAGSRTLDRVMSAQPTRVATVLKPLQRANSQQVQAESEAEVSQLMSQYLHLESEARSRTAVLKESIKRDKETWVGLKQKSKDLQALISSKAPGSLSSKSQAERQMEQLEKEVHALRRHYDKVMQEKKTAVAKLQNLQDTLKQLRHGTETSAGGTAAAQREAREMRQLENRLEKTLLKANEAHSIKHTYEQVLERLKQEQLLFDPQIKALGLALQTKSTQHQQALLAQRDAQRLKEAAKQELVAVEEQLQRDRVVRASKLEEQRTAAQALGEANKALLARQFKSTAAIGVMAGGAVTGAAVGSGTAGASEQHRQVATPQEAVAALCAATTTADPQAMVNRLVGLQDTLHKLTEMRQAATHQLSMLNTQVEAARANLEDLRSGGRQCSTQAALDLAQVQLREANAQADAAKASHDQVMKVYIDVRSGIEHLAAMVSPLPLPPGHVPVPMSEDTLSDVLAQCQQRLVACQAFIRTMPKAQELLMSLLHSTDLGCGPDT